MSDSEEYEYEYESDDQYGEEEQIEKDGNGSDDNSNDVSGNNAISTATRNAAIELENTFYEAEDYRQRGDLTSAMEHFERVVSLEHEVVGGPENTKWSFQAYDNIVKLCVSSKQWDAMVTNYQEMLCFLPFVTRNESTEAISSILDTVSTASACDITLSSHVTTMYKVTLETLKRLHNERLWFSMNIKLGRLYLEMQQFSGLRRLLDDLYAFCQGTEETQVLDHSKSTMLLEVFALDIQWCGATKNSAKLREIYPKTFDLDAAVADPRIMGVIREEGGKMYLEERKWMDAYNEFFESFRNYQEAGHLRATICLKYVVLANMLASSDINPFDSREAKVYQEVEEIAAMLLLRSAYETNDIVQFEKTLKNPKYKLLNDPIMSKYLQPLLRNIRCQVLKSYVRPYRIMQMTMVAKAVNVTIVEAEEIAVFLIQNGELHAKIHQPKGLLVMQDSQRVSESCRMYEAVERWSYVLDNVHTTIATRIQQQQ